MLWVEFHAVEPFGEESELDDFRTGIVAATVINVNKAKGSKPATPQDFMPRKRSGGPKKPKSAPMTGEQFKAFKDMARGLFPKKQDPARRRRRVIAPTP